MAGFDDILLRVGMITAPAISAFNGMMSHISKAGEGVTNIGKAMTAGVTLPIVAGFVAAGKEAIDFQGTVNNAARSLDLTTSEAEKFRQEALTLAPALGVLPGKFAELATEAGKLGVAKDELTEFGTVLATLSAISDTPIDQLTKLGGTIKTIFNQSTKDFEKFGAAVNTLDDKIGGSTPNILKFTSEVAAIGKTMGLTAAETAVFGSVFETVGVGPDVAATAFQNFAQQLFTINGASKEAKDAFESMGYSAEQFGQTMAKDPKTALIGFLDRLNAIEDPVKRSTLLLKIFGSGSGAEIASLATQSGKLSEAFKLVGNDTANLAKMQSEFAAKMKDPAIQMEVFKSQVNALAIQVGTVLLPIINDVLQAVIPVVAKFSEFLAQNPEWAKLIVMIGGFLAVVGPVVVVVGTLITAFTTVAGAISSVITFFGGLSLGTVTLTGIFGGLFTAIGTVLGVVFSVPGAIAAVVAAFVALAFNVGGCRDKLISFGSTIVNALGAAFNAGISLVRNFGSTFTSTFSSAFQSVVNAGYNLGSQLRSAIASAINSGIAALRGAASSFYSAGVGLMTSFANGVRASAVSAYNSVASVTSQIRNLLPFSPAKEGALKDLDKSGASFFKTFASNMIGDDLYNKVSGVLNDVGNVTLQAGSKTSPTASLVAAGNNTSSSGNATVINFEQNNTISATANAQDIIRALRENQRAFLDLISSAEFFKNRKQV